MPAPLALLLPLAGPAVITAKSVISERPWKQFEAMSAKMLAASNVMLDTAGIDPTDIDRFQDMYKDVEGMRDELKKLRKSRVPKVFYWSRFSTFVDAVHDLCEEANTSAGRAKNQALTVRPTSISVSTITTVDSSTPKTRSPVLNQNIPPIPSLTDSMPIYMAFTNSINSTGGVMMVFQGCTFPSSGLSDLVQTAGSNMPSTTTSTVVTPPAPPVPATVPTLEPDSSSSTTPPIRSRAMSFTGLKSVAIPLSDDRLARSRANSTTSLEVSMSDSSAVNHFQSTHIFHQLDSSDVRRTARIQIAGTKPVDQPQVQAALDTAPRELITQDPLADSPAMRRLRAQAKRRLVKTEPTQRPAVRRPAALLLFQQPMMSPVSVDVSHIHASAICVN